MAHRTNRQGREGRTTGPAPAPAQNIFLAHLVVGTWKDPMPGWMEGTSLDSDLIDPRRSSQYRFFCRYARLPHQTPSSKTPEMGRNWSLAALILSSPSTPPPAPPQSCRQSMMMDDEPLCLTSSLPPPPPPSPISISLATLTPRKAHRCLHLYPVVHDAMRTRVHPSLIPCFPLEGVAFLCFNSLAMRIRASKTEGDGQGT